MTTHDPLLPAVVLQRKAVVYVRQSTPQQVQLNLESQRRQYELVEVARRRGFTNIEVIDDDLGRTASGAVERPGFDRLIAALCAGQVGAVLCLEASRLARNGRDWHHLLELCGLVEARVIDLDGVYDPCRPNDRLLLGMKGSISEFELGIIRSRMYEAARSKAKRGELRISSPIGYAWDRYVGLGLDPDRRLQEVIRLVFQKFRELGSARQVLLWMASQNVHFLCRRLRLRQEREAHHDRRWSCARQNHSAFLRQRPDKPSPLEPFRIQTQARAVPPENLDPVSSLAAEHKQMPAIRTALEHVLHHHGEPIKSSPHVRRPAGHPDLRTCRNRKSSPAGLERIRNSCGILRRYALRQSQNPPVAQHHLDNRRASRFASYRPHGSGSSHNGDRSKTSSAIRSL